MLLLAGCVLGSAPARADMALTGSVVDALTERPIAGARVCVMGEMRGVAQHAITTTDAAGAFVAPLPAAICANAGETGATCGAASSGYLGVRVGISAARYQPVLLALTSAVMQARLLRARTYAVRGIVTDASNAPVHNVQVALIADDQEWRATCRAGDVWTDAAGTFEVAHVPMNAGPLSLRVQAPGYTIAGGKALRVNPEDGDAFFTVRLGRGCRVSGQVTWDNGEYATNARVWVRALKPEEVEINNELLTSVPFEPIDGCIAFTDNDGTFEIDNVPPGVRCTVHADAPGGMSDMQGPFTPVDVHNSKDVPLRLSRGAAWLALTLTDAANTRITNAVVNMLKMTDEHSGNFSIMPSTLLPDQRVLFGPMPATRMRSMIIAAPLCAEYQGELALEPGATSHMTIALLPVPTRYLCARDVDTQHALTNATFAGPQQVTVDRDGVARVPLARSCSVNANAPGYAPAAIYLNPEDLELTNTVWLAKPFDLTVYVYNADGTTATVGQVELNCTAPDVNYHNNTKQFGKMIGLGASGVVHFRTVPCYASNATLRLRSNASYLQLASLAVGNIQAGTQRIVAMTNPPLCRFTVTIITGASNQVQTVACMVKEATQNSWSGHELRRITQTSTFSVWLMDVAPTGTHMFTIRFGNGTSMRTNVTVALATRDIRLAPQFKTFVPLRVILRRNGKPVTANDVNVYALSQDKREYCSGTRTANGEYVCNDVDPDTRYDVHVGLATTSIVCTAIAPRTAPWYVDVPPLYTVRGVAECPAQPGMRITIYAGGSSRGYPAGRFSIANVPPGTFPVTVGVAGHSATTFPVTVTDHDLDLGTIRLTATGSSIITGRILGGSDKQRRVLWQNGLDVAGTMTAVAADGTFRTPPLTRGAPVALMLVTGANSWTNFGKILLTNEVMDLGDVRIE